MSDRSLQADVTLLELVDRLLDKGVVLSGDITLSVADVDLIYVGLRVLLSSVEAMDRSDDGAQCSESRGVGEIPVRRCTSTP